MKKLKIGGLCYYIPRELVNEWQELFKRVLDVSTVLLWLSIKGIDPEKDSPLVIQAAIEQMLADEIAKFKMLTGKIKKPENIWDAAPMDDTPYATMCVDY